MTVNVNEVRQSTPVTQSGDTRLTAFTSFIRWKRTLLRDNAAAYANTRARKAPRSISGQSVYVKKVVPGAAFIPAHPSRYEALGEGRGRKFKFFVIHRPGAPRGGLKPGAAGYAKAFAAVEKACRLYNIVYEFAQENEAAATHFVIGKGGELVQMVDLDDVAFHTKTRFHPFDRSLGRVSNDNSLGVELEGPVYDTFSDAQLGTCARLLRMMYDLYGISLDIDNRTDILGHDELDPRRKTDPGPNFPYAKVLKWAQDVTPFSFPAQFQPPVDIKGSVNALVAEAKIGALSLVSGQFREVAVAATDQMSTASRALRRSGVSRANLMQAASERSTVNDAAATEDAASKLRQERIQVSAVVAPPPNGVLFNWDTGKWTDVTG